MASITINFTALETTGGHAIIGLRVNGGQLYNVPMHIDEIRTVPTPEEIETFVKNMVKLHAIGKTAAQIKTNITQGLAVTV